MPSHKGITCDLFVDGEKATEYGEEITDNVCTVWVEAKEDKPYGFEVEFDGAATRSQAHRTVFHADETEAEASEETREDVIENLGSLKVTVQRCEASKKEIRPGPVGGQVAVLPAGKVNEKLIKGRALSHSTSLGPIRNKGAPGRWYYYATTYIDPVNNPYAIFVFKYTSNAHLSAMGFLGERNSEPEEVDADVLSMSAEEMQREIMLLRNRANETDINIKQERDVTIKREGDGLDRGEGSRKRTKKKPVFIDLCD
ncbi:hypothetical protein AA313_de0203921 [Arthrobotrys entomopaga]|nr:hypothetical protein AA313_de0203921 [Arthrobotrys entomopaga]